MYGAGDDAMLAPDLTSVRLLVKRQAADKGEEGPERE
jgi:hypothetical protein